MEKISTKNYIQKKIIWFILGFNGYLTVKFYKILFDYLIKKDYDQILSFWNTYLPEDSVIIDAGANMGQCMMRYSKYSKRTIVSIEPVKSTFRYLEKAKWLLRRKNVITINGALGDKEKTQEIYIPLTNENVRIDTQASMNREVFEKQKISYKTENVSVYTLNKVLKNNNIKRINLLKIDAEGAESTIIKDSYHIIEDFKPILSLEASLDEDFVTNLIKIGYKPYYLINSKLEDAKNIMNIKLKGNLILIYK